MRFVSADALAQLLTMSEVIGVMRDIRRITVCTRSADKASAFIDAARTRHPEVVVERGLSADDAAAAADIVVTATSSRVPVFDGRRLRPGTHVNAIGSFTPDARELDTVTVTRGQVYVDDRKHAWREAGELNIAHGEGAFAQTQIVGDLGDLVSGRCEARIDDEALTVFKSVDLSIEDVAVAARVWELSRVAASAGPS